MGGRGAGHQRQVDGRACLVHAAGHCQGDIVDTCNMLQGVEGGDLGVQPHHLVDKLPVPCAQKSFVFLIDVEAAGFRVSEEGIVHHRVKGNHFPLFVKEKAEHRQVQDRAGPVRRRGLREVRLRVKNMADEAVGERHPSSLRLRRKEVHGVAALVKQLTAGIPAGYREQSGKRFFPSAEGHGLLRGRAGDAGLLKEGFRGKGV